MEHININFSCCIFLAEIGDMEAVVNSVDEGDDISRESQPSSSDATRHGHGAFANVPSITITSVSGSGSYSDAPREELPESQESELPPQRDDESAEGMLLEFYL